MFDESIATAAEAVVGAMSDFTKNDLLEQLICYSISDCGDNSTVEQYEAATRGLVAPFPFVLDDELARSILAAAAAACGMLPGPGTPSTQVADLARATLNKEQFTQRIV